MSPPHHYHGRGFLFLAAGSSGSSRQAEFIVPVCTNLVETRAEGFDVAGDHRCQIGVSGGGEAPRHDLDHGHHLRRQRHVGEPHFFGKPAHTLLVLCERVAFFFFFPTESNPNGRRETQIVATKTGKINRHHKMLLHFTYRFIRWKAQTETNSEDKGNKAICGVIPCNSSNESHRTQSINTTTL